MSTPRERLGRTALCALLMGAAPSHAGDDAPRCESLEWIPTFGGSSGVNGAVRALAVFDDGLGDGPALYAAGEFIDAGGVTVNRIARWNAAAGTWSPLGSGMDDTVFALTVFDDGMGDGPALYAGGVFLTAGGVTVNHIARWNAASGTWAPLGSGTNSIVRALTVFDDGAGGGPALYAGGRFISAGGVTVNRVARWNAATETWSPVGMGMNNTVLALTPFDDGSGGGAALYAGGLFTTADGATANRFAKWNTETGTWSSPGRAMNERVYALTVFDDGAGDGPALYAGGRFTEADGATVNYIARWIAATGTWSPLGTGMNDFVYALAVFDDGSGGGPALYAGGLFTMAGGMTANGIARWNAGSAAWTPLGSTMDERAYTLMVFDDAQGGGPALFAGGAFTTSPAGSSYLAQWGCVDWGPPPCAAADLDCDGDVDGNDLAIVLGSWGPCGSPPCVADVNDDGVIDGNDLAIVLGAWGTGD